MTDAAIAAHIVEALEAAASREAGARTGLVSVTMDMLAPPGPGQVEVSVTRKTRSLIFLNARFTAEGGGEIASANSVHKVFA